MLDKVKNILLVLSGKGGVGKSTVSTQLALSLIESGYKTGLLDIDLCGSSLPYLLDLEDKDIYLCDKGFVPIYTDDNKPLAVMSIGFLSKQLNDPIIWSDPKMTIWIEEFLTNVKWDDLDYLIIDTPPSTSDEHITVMECMREVRCDGAIILTTPQGVTLEDVRKEITFCKKTNVPILGIVENMSGYVLFSSEHGAELAKMAGVPHLATVPIDVRIGLLCGITSSVITELPESGAAAAFKGLVKKITA